MEQQHRWYRWGIFRTSCIEINSRRPSSHTFDVIGCRGSSDTAAAASRFDLGRLTVDSAGWRLCTSESSATDISLDTTLETKVKYSARICLYGGHASYPNSHAIPNLVMCQKLFEHKSGRKFKQLKSKLKYFLSISIRNAPQKILFYLIHLCWIPWFSQ